MTINLDQSSKRITTPPRLNPPLSLSLSPLSQYYLFNNRMDSFCANALQRDVFPVPGGPCNNKVLFPPPPIISPHPDNG